MDDMRSEDVASGTWISPTLAAAVRVRMEKGEQALLFLNRRGYAPLTLCRACGHQIECSECDARMVEQAALNSNGTLGAWRRTTSIAYQRFGQRFEKSVE